MTEKPSERALRVIFDKLAGVTSTLKRRWAEEIAIASVAVGVGRIEVRAVRRPSERAVAIVKRVQLREFIGPNRRARAIVEALIAAGYTQLQEDK